MQLTAKHIKFIDQYLLKMGIDFYDVRLELTDHIATTFEENDDYKNLSFSEAIRKYHIENKDFVYANRFSFFNGIKMIWYNRNELKSILNQIFKLPFWICFICIFFIVKNDFIRFNIGMQSFNLYIILFCVMFGTQLFFQKILLKKRFKSVEIRSFVLSIIFMVFNPLIQLVSNPFWSNVAVFLGIGTILMFTLSSMPLYLKIYKKYNTIS